MVKVVVRVGVGVKVAVGVGVLVGAPVAVLVGVAAGVIRLDGRSMRGATQTGLSASAEPLANTVKMNLTLFPASALRSQSTV